MAQILIIAALAEEADALYAGRGIAVDHGFPLRTLDAEGHAVRVVTCGLGKVQAALTVGLHAADADYLIMSGTCGTLGAPSGQAYWISEAVQHDYGARQANAFQRYRAGDWPMGQAGALHFTAMVDPGVGLSHARIASGDSFVACPDAAAEMAATLGVSLVDMEVAAIAQCAMRLNRPWAAIKAVTDAANGTSGDDFHANLLRAAAQAAKGVERLVALLD